MKTAYLKSEGTAWTIRVVVWTGTTQREYFAGTYEGAMKIVDECHSNAYSPSFYDRDGRELADCGGALIPIE